MQFGGDILISERLKELREEKNLLQKDLAKHLNISTSAYGYYEQGKRNPDTETIEKLADFFNVSTDYLLGRTNYKKNPNISEHLNYNEIEKSIAEKLLNEGIITQDEPIPKEIFEKILKYGMEAAIEILKLEKELKK
ncbi:helix-turn-helix domain-containing protein [Sporanaerobacter acetigenes]|uniref:Helix-turn-helix n=1 Tax=Sporanaerobacter acetigenes DSM 13106 TaxID=1123281 RepID=A0A1M5VE77_9FIRM|nr:helix-turn-helix transcriptional regulator [Sporanaerobacter acetigenes]SHH73526.1 Helix-turn-helix [Sporanaerobacter acetigenes DSM 13106]